MSTGTHQNSQGLNSISLTSNSSNVLNSIHVPIQAPAVEAMTLPHDAYWSNNSTEPEQQNLP